MTFAPRLHRVSARDVEPAEVPGHAFRVMADAASTGGAYSLTEATSPVGALVPPHAHDNSVECFFILDGEYRLTVGGETRIAQPGDFHLVPRGAQHHFEVVGDQFGRAVVLFTPAGFETVFRRMPEIFGTTGEPGPLWRQLNAQFATRLLHDEPNPPSWPRAVVVPGSLGGAAGSVPLATPGITGTPLGIFLRSDPGADAAWDLPADTTALWVVAGRYRVELPDCSVTLADGDYLTLDDAARARAIALVPASQALFLRLRDQEPLA